MTVSFFCYVVYIMFKLTCFYTTVKISTHDCELQSVELRLFFQVYN